MDGTDCPIQEQSPFSRDWYSFKLNGPGLRYEIGLCIQTGKMVWVYGGVACGINPDLVLARSRYTQAVRLGELTVADKGYRDDNYFITPLSDPTSRRKQKLIMARHETINSRMKSFKILSTTYRHDLSLHPKCFMAIANIVHLMTINGHPLFEIGD